MNYHTTEANVISNRPFKCYSIFFYRKSTFNEAPPTFNCPPITILMAITRRPPSLGLQGKVENRHFQLWSPWLNIRECVALTSAALHLGWKRCSRRSLLLPPSLIDSEMTGWDLRKSEKTDSILFVPHAMDQSSSPSSHLFGEFDKTNLRCFVNPSTSKILCNQENGEIWCCVWLSLILGRT